MSKKRGTTTTTTTSGERGGGKKATSALLTTLSLLALFLLFVAFVLILSATAALQNDCGGAGTNRLWGGTGYFAPTSCSKFYRYPWWITFYTLFVLLLTLAFVAIRKVHAFRTALVGLLAVLTLLLMDSTNTFFGAKELAEGQNISGASKARARVWMAGGIIGSFASFVLIMLLGIHDERQPISERGVEMTKGGVSHGTTGVLPTTTAQTTTTTVLPTTTRETYPATV